MRATDTLRDDYLYAGHAIEITMGGTTLESFTADDDKLITSSVSGHITEVDFNARLDSALKDRLKTVIYRKVVA